MNICDLRNLFLGGCDDMSQSLVNFRMDEDLKLNMEKTCQELGMNMTTAFTIFAKKMTREKRIPFDVSVHSSYLKLSCVTFYTPFMPLFIILMPY